jgi:cobalt/nickel transport system permease protein
MHLPDGVLSAPVCFVTNGLAATALGYSAWQVARGRCTLSPARFSLVSAAVFAVQLLNFALDAGASGHLVGAVFAGALLGPWAGVLAVSIVLAVQAIAFGDGGVTTLGANILNIAVVGAVLGGWARSTSRDSGLIRTSNARAAWMAAVAVPLAAALCALELSMGSARPLGDAMAALVPFHAALGLVEAGATWVVLTLVARGADYRGACWAAIALAVILAPFASSMPDGLEAALGQLQLMADPSLPGWTPAPDYKVPGVADESLALIAAAGVGVCAIAGIAWLLAQATRLRPAVADPRRRHSSHIS